MTERDPAPVTGPSGGQAPPDRSDAPQTADAPGSPDTTLADDATPTATATAAKNGATAEPGQARDAEGLQPAGPHGNGKRAQKPVAVRPVRAPIAGLRQRMDSTAALRRSLDAKEAEALDLRASIDRLRHELDHETGPVAGAGAAAEPRTVDAPQPVRPDPRTANAPVPAADPVTAAAAAESTGTSTATVDGPGAPPGEREQTGGRGRTSLWVLTAVALTLLLLLIVSRCAASSGTTTTGATPAGSAAPGQSTGAQGSPGAQPAAGPAPATTPMAWPSGAVLVPPGLPATGPGLTDAGTHVEAAIDTDGTSIDVYESLVLPAARTEPLVLALPTLTNDARPALANVQVELDGNPVAVTAGPGDSLSAEPPSGSSYTKAVLRYRLASAVVAQQPAKANRAAAVVLPLTAGLSQAVGGIVEVRTSDPQVISVDCPTVDLAERLCAMEQNGVWTATLPATAQRPVVYLLLDTTT